MFVAFMRFQVFYYFQPKFPIKKKKNLKLTVKKLHICDSIAHGIRTSNLNHFFEKNTNKEKLKFQIEKKNEKNEKMIKM